MFHKFPSTPYIEFQKGTIRKEKVLTEKEIEMILSQRIYVEEKIDGANLGISFDCEGNLLLQNRGSYLYPPLEGQWKLLDGWMKKYENRMFDVLADEYILFGEWCYATHSIYYDSLPDWFVGFDILEKKSNRFLNVPKRNLMMNQIGISTVPLLGKGAFTLEQLKQFFGKSRFGNEECEGIYLRQDGVDYLNYRAKIVRDDFRQNIDIHWSKKRMTYNKIEENLG